MKEKGKKVYGIGLAVIVLVVVGAVLWRFVFSSVNRSAEKAGKAAFEAIYSCNYDSFVKATIYNETCQNALNMDLTDDLTVIEQNFKEMKEWMEETGETYGVTGTSAAEYTKDSAEYETGIKLFEEEYGAVSETVVTKVAKVLVKYSANYKDDAGEWKKEAGEDTFWCFLVDGKWYAFPMLGE